MTDLLLWHIEQVLATFHTSLREQAPTWSVARRVGAVLDMELQLHEMTRLLADRLMGCLLTHILSQPDFQAQATLAARSDPSRPLRDGGARPVTIRLLGGSSFTVTVPYLKPNRRQRRPGRKRKSGKRGKGGSGLYPTLAALGIQGRATPALTDEIVHQMSAADSHNAAFEALQRRGIRLNSKVIRRLFYDFAQRADSHRKQWLAQARLAEPCSTGPLAGARVVICTDGGRTRIRQPARAGRRRRRTRHRGFQAPWKEPKVLVLYVIDAQGNPLASFRPVLDATMGDCEEIFEFLLGYLLALGGAKAKQLMVVSDGAPWIWERVDKLAEGLGVERERIVEVVDFYHAMEAVYRVAEVPRWKSPRRKAKWLKRARRLLTKGHIESLVAHIKTLAVGRRAKAIKEHVGYFERHAKRMRYKWFRSQCVPIGSGAVESAVRRIVNLRLKSNGKFWLRDNANAMLLTRSYLKAGRLHELIRWSLQYAASWWIHDPSGPIEGCDIKPLHNDVDDVTQMAA